MIDIFAQGRAWQDAIQQEMVRRQAQLDQATGAAAYHQALSYPRNYPLIGQMANALTGPAGPPNNPSTGLFGSSNPQAGNLMQAYFMANAPGGNTIGLPTDGDSIGGTQVGSPNALVQALLSRPGLA